MVRCIDVGSLWQELNIYQEVYVTGRDARAMNSLFSYCKCTVALRKKHIFSLSNCVLVRAPYVDVNGDVVAHVSPAQIVIKPP